MPLSSIFRLVGYIGLIVAAAPWAALAQSENTADLSSTDERFRGLVRPSHQVQLNAPLDGLIGSIRVEEGQSVKAGDILAKMDDSIQKVALASAKLRAADDSEIRRQKLLLAEADIQLERMIGLEKSGAAQEWEVRRTRLQRDATAAALEAAEAQKRIAEENVKLEESRLERYELIAPFDGTVVRIDTEAGATLSNRDPMMTMFAFDPLEAVMFLPVDLYGKLEIGADYHFEAEAPVNRDLVGKLKTIEAVVDSASRTFRCVFTIKNPDMKLPAGFTIRFLWPQPAK